MKRTGSVSGSPAEKRPNTAQDEVHEHSAILFAEVDPGCAKEKLRWKRSPVGVSDVNETDLVFQQIDCDYAIIQPDKSSSIARSVGSSEKSVPVIRLFGVTQTGNSVLAYLHGYLPYFYAPVPVLRMQNSSIHDVCANFRTALNNALKSRVRGKDEGINDFVQMVDVEEKMSVMGFHGSGKAPFFKVVLAIPSHTPTARSILEEGLNVPSLGHLSYRTFESNIPFALRFMVDRSIGGAQWVKIPKKKFAMVPKRTGNCQIEIECCVEDLESLPYDVEEWSHIAPLRILSFDIECAGRPGVFPDAKTDPVIQIANLITRHGDEKPLVKNIFVLGMCSPIVGADVRCYENETDLLAAWHDFLVESDPDVITGYNILNFDVPYLLDRAQALRIDKFGFLSRLSGQRSRVKETKFSSNQVGTRESKEITMPGRLMFDMMHVVQRDYKLSSYTLNNVCTHFLGQQKEDVHHSIISQLHAGSNDDRRRLAVYCLKDAYLPQRLMEKLMALVNYVEMARVTGVPFTYLLSRGQGIKVMSQVLRKCRTEDLVVPTWKAPAQNEGYTGATVIEPRKGFYDKPVATLDFSSLYPSIMMAHNLCYTTLLQRGEADKLGLSPSDYEVTPTGDCFVKTHVRKGLLPRILESLLSARSQAKRLMAKETDKFKQQVYNGRQLALKVSANSVYGFTGQSVGQLPCLEISASVTAYGREMIDLTKSAVESEYRVERGYAHDAEVIYGDTDSVMVLFGVDSVPEAMQLGKAAAQLVTTKFPKPISLEFEKVYYPYLLMSKKRYAGLFWSKPEKWDKLDAKGIESVRRDNCGLVRYIIDTNLRKILIERDIDGSIEFTKNMIRDLLQNKVDLSLLIVTKQLKDDYANKQPHSVLAERMRKRDPATAPNVGDRVPYVIIRGDKSAKMYEKAEDPLYVLEHSVAVDSQYYLENQLSKPLMRMFQAIMDNPQSLLSGEHTRVISVPTPKTGGIVGFTRVRETCMGCRAPLDANERVLCPRCLENAPSIFEGFLHKLRTKEMEYSRLWTCCQNCQGSLHQEVLCTAADCPIFYMRTKVKKDLAEARVTLDKFDSLEW